MKAPTARRQKIIRSAAAFLAVLAAALSASCAALPFASGGDDGQNAVTTPAVSFESEPPVGGTDAPPGAETDPVSSPPGETTAAKPETMRPVRVTQAETTDRLMTPEYQKYAEEFSEKNQQCGWMDAEAARKMFNNAVEAWSWFYLTTAPLYGPYLDESCHQRVDLPGITTYEGLRKYLRNFFTAEITDSIMKVRADYVDIDGELCAIQADRGSDTHYGKITDYYFHFTDFSSAEFIVTVERFDDSGQPNGTEKFTIKMQMDARPYWHITDFPIWL